MEAYDPAREKLESYREYGDKLDEAWKQYDGGMITQDELLLHVEEFVMWHRVQEAKS